MHLLRALVTAMLVAAWVAVAGTGAAADPVSVKSVEALEGPDTVIKIHLSGPLATAPRAELLAKSGDQPDRLAIDLPGADMHGKPARTAEVGWGGVQRIRLGTPSADTARVVLDLDRPLAFDLAREGDVVAITLHDPQADVILHAAPDAGAVQEKPAGEKPADAKPAAR
jgi:hypothetical protein